MYFCFESDAQELFVKLYPIDLGRCERGSKHNPFRLQAFDILNELLSELPVVEDYVFTKFHEE